MQVMIRKSANRPPVALVGPAAELAELTAAWFTYVGNRGLLTLVAIDGTPADRLVYYETAASLGLTIPRLPEPQATLPAEPAPPPASAAPASAPEGPVSSDPEDAPA